MPANQGFGSIQGGAWDDALGPAFALGQGGASPALVAFPAGTTGRLYRVDASDIIYFAIQFPHDMLPGAVTLRPHVHWTMVANPTAGQNLIWNIDYNYAIPGGTFGAAMTPLTATTYVTVGDEIRKHLLTSFGDINITAGFSAILFGTLTAPTVPGSQNPVLLSFDIHYQKGPFGTFNELS